MHIPVLHSVVGKKGTPLQLSRVYNMLVEIWKIVDSKIIPSLINFLRSFVSVPNIGSNYFYNNYFFSELTMDSNVGMIYLFDIIMKIQF